MWQILYTKKKRNLQKLNNQFSGDSFDKICMNL